VCWPSAGTSPMTGSTPLMDVYRGRSFRFCFTNRQVAQAVVDFVWSQPDLRPIGNPVPAIAALTEPTQNGINDEKADSLRGHYKWGGLQVGLGWNRSKVLNPFSGQAVGDRRAWALPISYNMGPHTFSGTYTKAGDSRDVGAQGAVTMNGVVVTPAQVFVSGANTGARLLTLNYSV